MRSSFIHIQSLLIFLLISTLQTVVLGQNKLYKLVGGGSSAPAPVFDIFDYIYPSYVANRNRGVEIDLSYNPSSSGDGQLALVAHELDYAGNDLPIMFPNESLRNVPALIGAVVIIYSLPQIPDPDGPWLNLTEDALVGLFNGTMKWNDPEILKYNPLLAEDPPPDQYPTIITRENDGVGSTLILTSAFANHSKAWNDSYYIFADNDWPKSHIAEDTDEKIVLRTIRTPYSIGYVPSPVADKFNQEYATIRNPAGFWVRPSIQTIIAGAEDFALDAADVSRTNYYLSLVNGPSPNAYPLIGATYILMQLGYPSDCYEAYELMRYVVWMLSDPAASDVAQAKGYVAIRVQQDEVWEVSRSILQEFKCSNGINLYDQVMQDLNNEKVDSRGTIFAISIGVMAAIAACIIIAFVTWWCLAQHKMKKQLAAGDIVQVEVPQNVQDGVMTPMDEFNRYMKKTKKAEANGLINGEANGQLNGGANGELAMAEVGSNASLPMTPLVSTTIEHVDVTTPLPVPFPEPPEQAVSQTPITLQLESTDSSSPIALDQKHLTATMDSINSIGSLGSLDSVQPYQAAIVENGSVTGTLRTRNGTVSTDHSNGTLGGSIGRRPTTQNTLAAPVTTRPVWQRKLSTHIAWIVARTIFDFFTVALTFITYFTLPEGLTLAISYAVLAVIGAIAAVANAVSGILGILYHKHRKVELEQKHVRKRRRISIQYLAYVQSEVYQLQVICIRESVYRILLLIREIPLIVVSLIIVIQNISISLALIGSLTTTAIAFGFKVRSIPNTIDDFLAYKDMKHILEVLKARDLDERPVASNCIPPIPPPEEYRSEFSDIKSETMNIPEMMSHDSLVDLNQTIAQTALEPSTYYPEETASNLSGSNNQSISPSIRTPPMTQRMISSSSLFPPPNPEGFPSYRTNSLSPSNTEESFSRSSIDSSQSPYSSRRKSLMERLDLSMKAWTDRDYGTGYDVQDH